MVRGANGSAQEAMVGKIPNRMFHDRSGSYHHAKTVRASPKTVLVINAIDEKIITQAANRLKRAE
jgi:hypothetical protein